MLYQIQCYIIINQYCRNDFLFRNLNFLLYSFATKPSSGSTQPSSGAETLVIDGRFLSGNWETTFSGIWEDTTFRGISMFSLCDMSGKWGGLKSHYFSVILEEKFLFWDWKSYRRNSSNFILKQLNFFCEFWEQQYSLTCDNFQGYWSRGKNWFLAKENVTGNFESFPL